MMYRYTHMRFCFELDAIEAIEPWGEDEDRKLHWFGLTSGRYWISTPLGEALRYADDQAKSWGLPSPHVDYQVARLFEDLQSVLPAALEPVPSDIAAFVADGNWFARAEKWIDSSENTDERRNLCVAAMDWYQNRSLDTMYLTNGPLFHFWRTGDDVSIRWEPTGKNPEGIWSTPQGRFTIGEEQFRSAVYAFLDDVLRTMQERIDAIHANGWQRTDCKLDLPLLLNEQRKRAALVNDLKERRLETKWESVRRLLECLSMEF
jgi:hypothetical protein